MEEAILIN